MREGDEKFEYGLEVALRIFHEFVAPYVPARLAETIVVLYWRSIRRVVARLRYEREIQRGFRLLEKGGASALVKDSIALQAIRIAQERLRSDEPEAATEAFDENLNVAETRLRRRSLHVVSR